MATTAAASPIRWAREYETIYILRPDVEKAKAEQIIGRLKEVISRLDGTLTKLDNWGKRKLAYPIEKKTRGVFVYLKYVGYNDLVAELERNLRLVDDVVRFQTVLLAEDIDPSSVTVDPEELQYLHVEEAEEVEDAEAERARSLGMGPRGGDAQESEARDQSDEETKPEETKPEETKSEETKSGETKSGDADDTDLDSKEDSSDEDEREEG